jgi:hypothetical protein
MHRIADTFVTLHKIKDHRTISTALFILLALLGLHLFCAFLRPIVRLELFNLCVFFNLRPVADI